MRDSLKVHNNASIEGSLFEMWFFAKLKEDGLTLAQIQGDALNWPRLPRPFKSELPLPTSLFTGDVDVWIKPDRWNQAGFDAVHIKPKAQTVEFFQVTRAATHALNLTHFADSLINATPNFNIHVYFVVPPQNLEIFRVHPFTQDKRMHKLDESWFMESRVTVLGLGENSNRTYL
jgi:hypothetical protein